MIWPLLFGVLAAAYLFVPAVSSFLHEPNFFNFCWLFLMFIVSCMSYGVGRLFGLFVGSRLPQTIEVTREALLVPHQDFSDQTYVYRFYYNNEAFCSYYVKDQQGTVRKEYFDADVNQMVVGILVADGVPRLYEVKKFFTRRIFRILGIEDSRVLERKFLVPPDGYKRNTTMQ